VSKLLIKNCIGGMAKCMTNRLLEILNYRSVDNLIGRLLVMMVS